MWHEARRQERKIRGMLVDYRRRAERRRDFYEKIKADPTQFLQIHGRQCKLHLDPAIAAAADSAAMMPWQGQADNLIDRFDVRAHLDYIPAVQKVEELENTQEERQLNYERYRIIAQNSFLGIAEEKFLKQLHLEEQFGYTETKSKKEPRTGGAAIGFNYEDGTAPVQGPEVHEEDSEENSDSDLDVDLAINVSKIDSTQAHEMNKHGRSFGMSSNDFYSFLTNDLEEAEMYRLAKEEEHEKVLFSGRKSRRERRAHREKRLANRVISPPSYAARTSPTYPVLRESKSPSKSPSPENTGKITYITSFGGEEEAAPSSSTKPTYADKVKYGKPKPKDESRTVFYSRKRRSYSRNRSRRSRSRSRKRRSRSRSRNRYRRSRSRSRSSSKYRSRRNRRSPSSSSSSWSSSSSSSSSPKSRSPVPSNTNKKRQRSSTSRSKSPVAVKPPVVLPEKNKVVLEKEVSPVKPATLPRYYGRKKSDQSSSELSDSSAHEETTTQPANNPVPSESKSGYGNNSGTSLKKPIATNKPILERFKRIRQALLNKQFRADKIAEQLKSEREKQEQQTREDELREFAIKLRRQRQRRTGYDSSSSSEWGSGSVSPNSSAGGRLPSKSPSPRRRSKEREPRRRSTSREPRRRREEHKRRSPQSGEDGDREKERHWRDDRERDRGRNRREDRGGNKGLVDY